MNKKNWAEDLSITLKNGQKIQVCIFQGRHTVGQKAHEKMLSITNHHGNANEDHQKLPHTCQNGCHQKEKK